MTAPRQGRGRRARRVVPLLVLVALAAIPAIALAGLWQYAEANEPPPTTTTTTTLPPPPVDELTTDLLSYRRSPTPLAERVAEEEADEEFAQQALAVTERVSDGSCLHMLAGESILAEAGADTSAIPASNQKLLVAATALAVVGAEHRYSTEVMAAAPVDGVVAGNIYLVGGGDPVLRTQDVPDPLPYPAFNTTSLEALADELFALGVTTVDGDVVGDGSRYDDEFRAPSWGDDITNWDAGPYDALLVNDGLISNGNYGLDPSRSAARVFFDLLVARGIAITGSAANEARPADVELTTLAAIESAPLPEIIEEMLHTSDNNTAEMMLKEIGVADSGRGTRQAGLEAMWSTLGDWGVPRDGLEMLDGSGLSRDNRVSCATLSAVLADSPVAAELTALLPLAGRDGTLSDQFVGTSAEGVLRAKTGTLTDVKALSGTQPARDGTPVDFAVILNGVGVNEPAAYQPVWADVIDLIEIYPVEPVPDVDRFAPR